MGKCSGGGCYDPPMTRSRKAIKKPVTRHSVRRRTGAPEAPRRFVQPKGGWGVNVKHSLVLGHPHRGLFAKTKFEKGSIVFVIKLALIPKADEAKCDENTVVHDGHGGVYEMRGAKAELEIATAINSCKGLGVQQNIEWVMSVGGGQRRMLYIAKRRIAKGEELYENYKIFSSGSH